MKAAYVQVLLPRPVAEPFDYAIPHYSEQHEESHGAGDTLAALALRRSGSPSAQYDIEIGSIVEVPFGSKTLWGVVWSANPPTTDLAKIKTITTVSDLPPMPEAFRRYIEWVAYYTFSQAGMVLAMALPTKDAFTPPTRRMGDGLAPSPAPALSPHTLSAEQQAAATSLAAYVQAHTYSATLLEGVTGSGKTEVYSEAIRAALNEGKQVLVLLPEIVLTSQLIARFERSLGFTPLQWHSGLTPKQRREGYRAIAKGDAKLIVGARSALFLPYPNLGLIVVDEEHEASFKQEDGIIYHARDMAVARAHHEQLPIVLVTASPSLETLHNVQAGKFSVLHLHERHGQAELPAIRMVDMREEKLDAQHFISTPLKNALIENMARQEQSLLYLNRRGYAPLTLCRTCGYRFQSPDSSAWMVLHWPKGKREQREELPLVPQSGSGSSSKQGGFEGSDPKNKPYLLCHHSGYRMNLPEKCPECEEKNSFAACGPGVERLKEELTELLPEARIALMTSDTVEDGKDASALIQDIEDNKIDIIIGTQMVAKGHHFPNLTLVGVVDADLGLEGGDLRAAERSFQLLQQVAGRAGREGKKGKAILQSYQPENAVMQALSAHDRHTFMDGEFARRKDAKMPPFSRLAAIIVSGKNENMVRDEARKLVKSAPRGQGFRVLGPAPSPMLLLRGQYRYRILIIAERDIHLQKLLHHWLDAYPLPRALKVKVDIDPYSFV